MGSTGEPDRKRRQFSSISPTAAKKHQFVPVSEEKKLDAVVLRYQNHKLIQKLESQKAEVTSIKYKFLELQKRKEPHDDTLLAVKISWDKLVGELEATAINVRETNRSKHNVKHLLIPESSTSALHENDFLSRITETGATENSSVKNITDAIDDDRPTSCEVTKRTLQNVVAAIDDLWQLKEGLSAAVLKALPEDGLCRKKILIDTEAEVKKMRLALSDVHLRHRSLAGEIQRHRDTDAKNKVDLRTLKGELESTVAELEESNCKLSALKSKGDVFVPMFNLGSKLVSSYKIVDKEKDLMGMESVLQELLDQASSRALQLKGLHEERIEILKQLKTLQNTLKSVKYVSSSPAYMLVRTELAKSKAEIAKYQALLDKLQGGKEALVWKEREMDFKDEFADVFNRSAAAEESKTNELRMDIQRQIDQRSTIETKLDHASRQPGRKEIITEFKALVSSFPEDMSSLQSQLSKYKDAASDFHSLQADVQSLSIVLDRKAKEIETLLARSSNLADEMMNLQDVVRELKQSDIELRLILEMYRRESIDPRDILEARDSEYMAWALVQTIQSSLDEHTLELRVKTANEAEALSQQTLATAEAEIAELRQKLEVTKRDFSKLSKDLKSKQEENEAYISEIESIGHAYDDIQTQNQQLLQQVTERDDYNIKVVLEGLRARQLHDALYMDKKKMEKELHQANASLDFYNIKAARIEDQFNNCSDQVQKLSNNRLHLSATLESTRKRLLEVNNLAQDSRDFLQKSQFKLDKNRTRHAEMQIELERERFDRKRIEEELEVARRKVLRLKANTEEFLVIEKLQEELREYKEVLKCSICVDRPKEVVLTKCCHLFCNPCVQRILKTRHRKCPTCSATFGANDVKPVYI